MQFQIPLVVQDFSGGFTDNKFGPLDQAVTMDNFFISSEKKPFTRPGSALFDSTYTRIDTGTPRVNTLINFNQDTALLAHSAASLYEYGGSGWTKLLGPVDTNEAFPSADETARLSHGEWRGHLYLASNSGDLPMKLYRNDSNVTKIVTMGLPRPAEPANYVSADLLTEAEDLANDLKSVMVAHFADVTQHSAADTVADALVTAPDATDLATLLTLTGQLLAAYDIHYKDSAKPLTISSFHASGTTSITKNPAVYDVVPQVVTGEVPTTLIEAVDRLNDLLKCYRFHDGDLDVHLAIAANPPTVDTITDGTRGFYSDANWQMMYDMVNDLYDSMLAHALNEQYLPVGGHLNSNTTVSGISDTTHIEVGDYVHEYPGFGNAIPVMATVASKTSNSVTLSAAATATRDTVLLYSKLPIFRGTSVNGNATATMDASSDLTAVSDLLTAGQVVYCFPPLLGANAAYGAALNHYPLKISSVNVGARTVTFATNGNANAGANTLFIFLRQTDKHGSSNIPSISADATTPATLESALFSLRKWYAQHNSSHLAYSSRYYYPTTTDATLLAANNPLADEWSLSHVESGPKYFYDSFGGIRRDNQAALLAAILELQTQFNEHQQDFDVHYPSSPDDVTEYTANDVSEATTATTPSFASYKYAIVMKHSYLDSNNDERQVLGPTLTKLFSVPPISSSWHTLKGLPVLANGSTGNYATDTIKIEIYRSINAGKELYKVGEVTNGTTTFVDSVTDDQLTSKEGLYTNGGVVDYDAPPIGKYLHVVSGVGYLGDVTLNGVNYPNRVQQSVPGVLEAWPGDFYLDLPHRVMGVASAKELPMAFTKTGTYRIEGQFDELGRGFMRARPLSETVGLDCPNSLVKLDDGLLFAGHDSYYFTDGFQLIRLNYKKWGSTYAGLVATSTKQLAMVGCLNPSDNRVWWAVDRAGSGNDACFVLDMNFGLGPENSVFTTISNGDAFAPSALCYFNGQMLRGDYEGIVYKHDASYKTDPQEVATDVWYTKAIVPDYISTAPNYGADLAKKWSSEMTIKFNNEGNFSAQIKSINDLGRNTKSLTPIRYRGTPTGIIDEKRHFPQNSLRFTNKQIEVTAAKVVIVTSAESATCTIDASAHTIVLDGGATWPISDPLDYLIAFDTDGYVTEYPFVYDAGTGLVSIDDPGNTLVSGAGVKWVIRGIPKGEVISLHSYTVTSFVTGDIQTGAKGESGEPA